MPLLPGRLDPGRSVGDPHLLVPRVTADATAIPPSPAGVGSRDWPKGPSSAARAIRQAGAGSHRTRGSGALSPQSGRVVPGANARLQTDQRCAPRGAGTRIDRGGRASAHRSTPGPPVAARVAGARSPNRRCSARKSGWPRRMSSEQAAAIRSSRMAGQAAIRPGLVGCSSAPLCNARSSSDSV